MRKYFPSTVSFRQSFRDLNAGLIFVYELSLKMGNPVVNFFQFSCPSKNRNLSSGFTFVCIKLGEDPGMKHFFISIFLLSQNLQPEHWFHMYLLMNCYSIGVME